MENPCKRARKSVHWAETTAPHGFPTSPPSETPLAVSITKHEVVRFPESFVEYTLFVHQADHPVKVLLRRYRQFVRLHHQIMQDTASLNLPSDFLPALPEKRWFSKQRWVNRWDERFQYERRMKLQEYLRVLIKIEGLGVRAGLGWFLELEGGDNIMTPVASAQAPQAAPALTIDERLALLSLTLPPPPHTLPPPAIPNPPILDNDDSALPHTPSTPPIPLLPI